ncbi:MAG: hypothetical protein HZA31_03965 [Opitutae bacterium]|nr:hypothetical protein [Opitutae bacterium]
MKISRALLFWFASAVLAGAAAPTEAQLQAPFKGLSLPVFTKDNHRLLLLRSNELKIVSPQQYDLTDMQLTFFSGDATNRVETVLLSPAASFFLERNLAKGERGVRLVRDDVEMTGQKWSYEPKDKKVVLDGNVRVIFRAELKNLLK